MFKTIDGGKMPSKATKYSACVDLFANEDVIVGAGETAMVGLGVCINLDWNVIDCNFLNSHYLQLILGSSLGKNGLILPSNIKMIDLDYKDEIKILIHNPLDINYLHDLLANNSNACKYAECKINKGDKIAQIALLEHKSYLFGIESDVERSGGFGSTDGDG